MTIDDTHPEVDLRSVLGRLRDDLEELVADGAITLGAKWPAAQDFVDAMDDGDALLVPLRPAPLAADELRDLAGALGDDIAVVRLPDPDFIDGTVAAWCWDGRPHIAAPGARTAGQIRLFDGSFEPPDVVEHVALKMLAAVGHTRAAIAEAVDG